MKSFRITVQVSPNANRDEIVGWQGERLKIKVKAPAVEGKANDALLRFLTKCLGVHRRQIRIERGSASKLKVLAFETLEEAMIRQKIKCPTDVSCGSSVRLGHTRI